MSVTTPTISTRSADAALRARSAKVVPGGMYGHLDVASLPAGYPQFYAAGEGIRLTDVDGNEYLDLMCGFGPMISGYRNPVVEAAAAAVQSTGDVLGGPGRPFVELAELLVDTVRHADWAMFAKNGTDATSLAVVIARAATGKKKLLKGVTAYHGANAWFTPNPAGTTAEDRANILPFTFNDLASLEAAAAQAEGDVAAIILSPFGHDLPTTADQSMVDPAFAAGVRALANRIGAVLVMDEVRTGFRLNTGGAWESLGIEPDLTAYSKAIANGFALAAVVGIDSLREAASSVYATGSFWYGSTAMAAAVANITQLRSFDSPGHLAHVGGLLRTGLQTQAESYGFSVVQSGPLAMPFLRFENDDDFALVRGFADAAVRRGVLLHPAHNWFLSTAHTEADIALILERTDDAFAEVKSTVTS
jgi:glutamate-1-semialdehyde 2,1-aminomutase